MEWLIEATTYTYIGLAVVIAVTHGPRNLCSARERRVHSWTGGRVPIMHVHKHECGREWAELCCSMWSVVRWGRDVDAVEVQGRARVNGKWPWGAESSACGEV